jgi:hypothetical protein
MAHRHAGDAIASRQRPASDQCTARQSVQRGRCAKPKGLNKTSFRLGIDT